MSQSDQLVYAETFYLWVKRGEGAREELLQAQRSQCSYARVQLPAVFSVLNLLQIEHHRQSEESSSCRFLSFTWYSLQFEMQGTIWASKLNIDCNFLL